VRGENSITISLPNPFCSKSAPVFLLSLMGEMFRGSGKTVETKLFLIALKKFLSFSSSSSNEKFSTFKVLSSCFLMFSIFSLYSFFSSLKPKGSDKVLISFSSNLFNSFSDLINLSKVLTYNVLNFSETGKKKLFLKDC
jgi:hypothetical protein